MADVAFSQSSSDSRSGHSAIAHDLTGAACTGTITKWVGPCEDVIPQSIALLYDETGGGISQVVVSILAKCGGQSTEYPVVHPVTTVATSWTITATGNLLVPIAPISTVPFLALLAGIDELGVRAVFTGTGTGADAFRAVVLGTRMP
jgi:hypothetical protein